MPELLNALLVQNIFAVESLVESRKWEPIREGVSISKFYEADNAGPVAALLRYEPGAQIPEHEHMGYEHILIISGSQKDDKAEYQAGSLLIHPPGTRHAVTSDFGCVALAIWARPVKFI